MKKIVNKSHTPKKISRKLFKKLSQYSDTKLLTFGVGVTVLAVAIFLGIYSQRGKPIVYKTIPDFVLLGVRDEPVSNGVAEITANAGGSDTEGIPGIYAPGKGNKYICINVELHNLSGGSIQFIPIEEVLVIDEVGNQYQMTGAPRCKEGLGGPLETGEIISGELGFIVPKMTKTLKFFYYPLNQRVKPILIDNILL